MNSPVRINLTRNKSILIRWDDLSETNIQLDKLRELCPCATCKTERERQSNSYKPIFNQNQITVKSMAPVGNYALGITWNDGHNTGIYEYSYLKILSSNKTAN